MKSFGMRLGIATAVAMLAAGCVVAPEGYYGGDAYGAGANYNPYCDYYTPPWGYPPDYCRYQVWSEPVYYGGVWYGGPIYYRAQGGVNLFWLNGGWRRDEWRGARPRIDWNRGGNQYWHGDIHRGRDDGRRGREDRRRDRGDRDNHN